MQNLEIDPNKEYILAGDISMSMTAKDVKCNDMRRYDYMLEKFQSFIQTASDFDEHGAPTVILFGENVQVHDHVTLEKIADKLKNVQFEGATNIHSVVECAYDLHRAEKSEMAKEKKLHPGTKLLIFTDGCPTNKAALERILFTIANQIDTEDEFQIHFLTVGTIDASLQGWLDSLHDNMEDKAKNPRDFDIIHISEIEKTTFLSTVNANRHEDKVA